MFTLRSGNATGDCSTAEIGIWYSEKEEEIAHVRRRRRDMDK